MGAKLSTLPRQFFDHVFQGSNAIKLYKCGDRRLQQILFSHRHLQVTLHNDAWNTTSRFPAALLYFQNLRELTITRRHRLMDSLLLGRYIQNLTPNLLKLHLLVAHAADCFLLNESPDWTLYERPGPMPGILDLPVSHLARTTIWSIKEAFPELQSLAIGGLDLTWAKRDLLELPDSLTELSLPSTTCLGHIDVIELLPRRLVSLGIKEFGFFLPSDARALPRNLQALTLGSGTIITDEASRELPSSLTVLNCAVVVNARPILPSNLENLFLLPVTGNALQKDWISSLRTTVPYLTMLALSRIEMRAVVDDTQKKFQFMFLPEVDRLPSSLMHLTAKIDIKRTSSSEKYQNLVHDMNDEADSGTGSDFNLTCSSDSDSPKFSPKNRNLFEKQQDNAEGTTFLTDLSKLKTLSITVEGKDIPSIAYVHLLRSIRSNLRTLHIYNQLEYDSFPWDKVMGALPSSIKHISIARSGSKAKKVQKLEMVPANIPSSVELISILTANIAPSRIERLPKHLFQLELVSSHDWLPKHVNALPRTLETLYLHNASMADMALAYLPRKLTKLIVFDIFRIGSMSCTKAAKELKILYPSLATEERHHLMTTIESEIDLKKIDYIAQQTMVARAPSILNRLLVKKLSSAENSMFWRSMKYVPADGSPSEFAPSFEDLPPGLTELKLEGAVIYQPKAFRLLPLSLKKLQVAAMLPQSFAYLPEGSLTWLECSVRTICLPSHILQLPVCLTKLSLRLSQSPTEQFLHSRVRYLPEGLEGFEVTFGGGQKEYIVGKSRMRWLLGPMPTPDPRVIERVGNRRVPSTVELAQEYDIPSKATYLRLR